MKYSTHEMIAKSASVINNYAVTLLMRGEFQSAGRTFRDAIDIMKENHEAVDKPQGVSLNHTNRESNTIILSTSSLVSKVQAAAERVSNISKFQSVAPMGFVQAIDSDSFETLSQAASWVGRSSPVVGSSVYPIFLRDHGHDDPLHPDALAAMVLYNYAIATYLTELLESQVASISSPRTEETKKKNTTRERSASYKLFQMAIGIISRVLGDPSSIQTSQDAQFSAVYILVLNNMKKALLLNRNSIGLGEEDAQLQQEVLHIDEWITRLQLHHQLNFSFLANDSNAARAA